MAQQKTYKTCISCGREGFHHWQLFTNDRRNPTCRYCGAPYVSVHIEPLSREPRPIANGEPEDRERYEG